MRPIDADKLKADFWENVGDNAFFTLAVACRIIDRQETIDPDESPLFLEELKAKIYEAGFKDGQRLRPQTEMHDAEEEKTEKKNRGDCGSDRGGKMNIIRRWMRYLKRPKCPNRYNCGDCIHADMHWEGIKFRGFSCRINAR